MRLGINARFLDAPVTGVQRFAREVVPLLLEAADCVLFSPRGTDVPAAWRGRAAVVEGALRGHAWEQLELPRRASAAAADVVLHLSGTAPLRGGRDVMVVHDLLPITHPAWFAPRFARWYRFVVPRAAARCARVITVSHASRDAIRGRLGIEPGRIVVVTQGVAPFAPAAADAVRRARHIFDLPGAYILATGAGDPRKNLNFLGRVAAEWRQADGGAPPFVAVGEVTAHVHGRRAPVPDGVRPLGRVSDAELAALYTAAGAFAFPSVAEGFGRPPLEAMACGAPAVVADTAAAREVAAGARIVPLDAGPWVEALRAALAEDPARRAERAASVAARFTWRDAAAGVLAACRSALETGEIFA